MKIAIVGCGLAGLSTYISLRKYLPGGEGHQITIYESREEVWRRAENNVNGKDGEGEEVVDGATPRQENGGVGGTIGVSANGMKVLKELDEGIYKEVLEQGYGYENLRLRSSNGWDLNIVSRRVRKGDVTVMMRREDLWHILRNRIPDEDVFVRKVEKVTKRGTDGPSTVTFADGTEEFVDLVVGADGVRSVVRKAVLGLEAEPSIVPIFSGYCTIWGYISAPIPKTVTASNSIVFVVGSGATFGYSSYRPVSKNSLTWFASWSASEFPTRKSESPENITRLLNEKYKNWNEPTLMAAKEKPSSTFIYPISSVPNLPSWGDGGIVVLGDAAHAMTPALGQGASQAFEDSQAFGMLLGLLLETKDFPGFNAVDVAAKALYECRQPRIARLRNLSAKVENRNSASRSVVMQYVLYFSLWVMWKVRILRNTFSPPVDRSDWVLHGWNVNEEVTKVLDKAEWKA